MSGMRSPEISLRQLQYLAVTAQHGSYKAAAETLNVSTSSLSLAIAHLEKTTGLQLFERRHARGVVLTDDGRELALEARNILHQVEGIQRSKELSPLEIETTLRIGCLSSISAFVMPKLILSFRGKFPSVDVDVHEGNIDDLLAGLSSGKFDMVITYDTDLPSAINMLPICGLPPHVLLASTHSLATEKEVSLQQLSDEPYILADYPNTRDYLLSVFSSCGVKPPNICQRVQSYELLRNLVGYGLGYAVVNVCPPFGNDPDARVVALPITEQPRVPELVIANLQRARLNRAQKAFIETTVEVVGSLKLMI